MMNRFQKLLSISTYCVPTTRLAVFVAVVTVIMLFAVGFATATSFVLGSLLSAVTGQGFTLVHTFRIPQRKHFLWDELGGFGDKTAQAESRNVD